MECVITDIGCMIEKLLSKVVTVSQVKQEMPQ